MGVFEPWHLIIILFAILLHGGIFGAICAAIASDRTIGGTAGFFLGFFLGLIGLIIVLCSSRKLDFIPFPPSRSAADELKKYKELLDSGAITEDEYNFQKSRLLNRK